MKHERKHDAEVEVRHVDPDTGRLRSELAFSAQLTLGVLSGICIALFAVVWSMNGLRDMMKVPELHTVPINDPPPNIPGPTITYWLAWAIPSLVVYSLGAILFWRWKPLRWLIVSFMIGFVAVSLLCIPLIIYIDVTGF